MERLIAVIKDRILLGAIAGVVGNIVKTAIDEVSLHLKISQRPFWSTAAGVWLPSKLQATSSKGRLLGEIMNLGMAILGGIGIVQMLTATGKDQIIIKGLTSGIAFGSGITALLSAMPTNKIRPKDAASNLSYMLSHAGYGLVATAIAARLGDPSLFTEKSPASNWVRMVAGNVK